MKNTKSKIVHICLASHDEVMFRDHNDYVRAFNYFAEGVFATESRAIAEGFMSDHFHICVQTDSPQELLFKMRNAYVRYFNSRYHRNGRLAERNAFVSEIDGACHLTACVSYVLRQGLHHGLTTTVFEYPYTSANALFKRELGKTADAPQMPEKSRYQYLLRSTCIDPSIRMDNTGQLFREDVIDTHFTENIFITPKNFNYHMHRPSDASWISEQTEKEEGNPVTLDAIERGVCHDTEALLNNERGRVDSRHMTDMQLCELIDKKYLPRYSKKEFSSIYAIKLSEREAIANKISADLKRDALRKSGRQFFVTDKQLVRCLALKKED